MISVDNIIVVGFDYKHSLLGVREKVFFTPSKLAATYQKIKNDKVVKESLILFTCNRSEIYVYCDNTIKGIEYLKSLFLELFDLSSNEIIKNIIIRQGFEAIEHCFRVTGGYESLIVGEDQILGQVKNAYEAATKHKASSKVLNRLFLDSITTAKKIKTQTCTYPNSLSISSIGIKLLEQKIDTLSGKKALIIGLGKMNQIAIQNLLKKNLEKIYITNRTTNRTLEFVQNHTKLIGIDFKNRYEYMNDVDFVISCTSAPHLVINKDRFLEIYTGNKPVYLLDLAMPRDIDPEIFSISGVNLLKMNDLKQISKQNYEKRLISIKLGKKFIKKDVQKYLLWIEKTNKHSKFALIKEFINNEKILSNYA